MNAHNGVLDLHDLGVISYDVRRVINKHLLCMYNETLLYEYHGIVNIINYQLLLTIFLLRYIRAFNI